MNVQNSRNGEPQREQVIHLNPGDEIATIRDKIQWAGAPRVVLYVPRRNKALRDKMNLKLVQRTQARVQDPEQAARPSGLPTVLPRSRMRIRCA